MSAALAWAAAQARLKALVSRRVARSAKTATVAEKCNADAEQLEAYAAEFDALAAKDFTS